MVYFKISPQVYLIFHIIAELFSIVVSFSIFGIGWFSYPQNKNRRMVFLGISFFVIGTLDLLHLLIYPGMPYTKIPPTMNDTIQIWLLARFLTAISIFISAFIKGDSKSVFGSKSFYVFVALGVLALSAVIKANFSQYIPLTFIEGIGLTTFKKITEYVIILIFFVDYFIYWKKFRKEHERIFIFLLVGISMAIFSELALTLYKSIYDTYNLLGHIYKILSFMFLYYAIFLATIENPYTIAKDNEEVINIILKGSGAGTWDWNIKTGELKLNERWANILGYTLEELEPISIKTWEKYAHPDDLKESDRLLEEHFIGKKDYYECDARMKHRDGSWIWVADRGKVIEWGLEGEPIRMVGIHLDITSQKNAEILIRESEKKFSTTFQNSPTALLLTEINSGKIVDVNEAFSVLSGYTYEELINKSTLELGLWYNKNQRDQSVEEINKGIKVHQSEVIMRTKFGELKTILFSADAINLGNKNYLLSSASDITELKRVTDSLKTSEEKYEKAFKSVPYAITIRRLSDRKFIEVNEGFCNIFGYTPQEVMGSDVKDLNIWKDDNDRVSMEKDLINGVAVIDRQYKFVKKDGTPIIGNFSAQKIVIDNEDCLLVIMSDITQKRESQEIIEELNKRNEAVLASMGDAVFAVDDDERIILFNKSAEVLMGVKLTDAIGKNYKKVLNLIDDTTGKTVEDFIYVSISENRIVKANNNLVIVRKDGTKIPVDATAAPIRDELKEILGWVLVLSDITEEKSVDRAKNEIISLTSHQLRTPLTALRWASEALASENTGPLNDNQKEYTTEILHSSIRMIALVNDILNVSKLELGTFKSEPKYVDIENIVKNITRELDYKIKAKNLNVKTNVGSDLSNVWIDEKIVGIIITNLFSNAIKYTPQGGKVELTVEKKANGLNIKVKDTGIGISKEQQSHIFDKMYRGDNASLSDPDGTGLGLYIVKQIADQTKGNVGFESELNKGTTFNFFLPFEKKA